MEFFGIHWDYVKCIPLSKRETDPCCISLTTTLPHSVMGRLTIFDIQHNQHKHRTLFFTFPQFCQWIYKVFLWLSCTVLSSINASTPLNGYREALNRNWDRKKHCTCDRLQHILDYNLFKWVSCNMILRIRNLSNQNSKENSWKPVQSFETRKDWFLSLFLANSSNIEQCSQLSILHFIGGR